MPHALFVCLAVVGVLPGSLLPVVVTAARRGLEFTITHSASLAAVAIVCAAVGALTIAIMSDPRRCKLIAALALGAMGLLDLGSIAVSDFTTLLALRSMHGFVGGALTGIGYVGIGKPASPDRLFGVLLAAQFLVGGAGIAFLPGAIITHGAWPLLTVLASAAAVVLALVPIMPDLRTAAGGGRASRSGMPRGAMVPALVAPLLFEAGHTAASAFMLEIGPARGIGMPVVQSIVGVSAMAEVVGATGPAMLGLRWGRIGPILWASAAAVVAGALLLVPSSVAFAPGALVGSIAWAWSIPLVLGGCAAIVPDNCVAIWLSFLAKLGLATGPLLGALVVADKTFVPAIVLSCVLTMAGALILLRLHRLTPATAS